MLWLSAICCRSPKFGFVFASATLIPKLYINASLKKPPPKQKNLTPPKKQTKNHQHLPELNEMFNVELRIQVCRELLSDLTSSCRVRTSVRGTMWARRSMYMEPFLIVVITCIPDTAAIVPAWERHLLIKLSSALHFWDPRRAVHRHVWVQTSHSWSGGTGHGDFCNKRTDTRRIRS